MFNNSWNLSYAVTDWFRPLVELNHFHMLCAGDRDLADNTASGDQEDLAATIVSMTGPPAGKEGQPAGCFSVLHREPRFLPGDKTAADIINFLVPVFYQHLACSKTSAPHCTDK